MENNQTWKLNFFTLTQQPIDLEIHYNNKIFKVIDKYKDIKKQKLITIQHKTLEDAIYQAFFAVKNECGKFEILFNDPETFIMLKKLETENKQ